MTTRDIELIQSKANLAGIPYQTLISSVLHRWVTGQFKDVGH